MSSRERADDFFTFLLACLLALVLKCFIEPKYIHTELMHMQKVDTEMPLFDAKQLRAQIEGQCVNWSSPQLTLRECDDEDLDYLLGLSCNFFCKVAFAELWLAESQNRAISAPIRDNFTKRYRDIHPQTSSDTLAALKEAHHLDELCWVARSHWAQLAKCDSDSFQIMLEKHSNISGILLIMTLVEHLQNTNGWMRPIIRTALCSPIDEEMRYMSEFFQGPEASSPLTYQASSPSTVSSPLSSTGPYPLFFRLLTRYPNHAGDSARILAALLPILSDLELKDLQSLFATDCECVEWPPLRLCKLLIALQLGKVDAGELEWVEANLKELIIFEEPMTRLMALIQDRHSDLFLKWGKSNFAQGTYTKIALGLAKDIAVAKELMEKLPVVESDIFDYIIHANHLADLNCDTEPGIVVKKLTLAIRKLSHNSPVYIPISSKVLECMCEKEFLLTELRRAVDASLILRFVITQPAAFARLLRNSSLAQVLYRHRDFIGSCFCVDASKFLGALTARDFMRFYYMLYGTLPEFKSIDPATHGQSSFLLQERPVLLYELHDLPAVLYSYIQVWEKNNHQATGKSRMEMYSTIHTALRFMNNMKPVSHDAFIGDIKMNNLHRGCLS